MFPPKKKNIYIYIPNYSRTFALCIIKHIFYICRPFSKLHSRFFLFTSVWIRAEYGSNRHQIASVISEQTRPEQQPEGVVIEMKYIRYYYFGYLLSITSQYDQRKEWKNTNINLMYSPRLPQHSIHPSFTYPSMLAELSTLVPQPWNSPQTNQHLSRP